MRIHNLATEPMTDTCSDKYLLSVELHRAHISSLQGTVLTVDPMLNTKCKGDFFALLNELDVEKKYHFIVMEHNGYRHPSDYKTDIITVNVPDTSELDTILTLSNLS
jgi:hypothetical protein